MAPRRGPLSPLWGCPLSRRRVLWAARVILERHVLGRAFDPGISRILDALYLAEAEETAMTPELAAALKPSAFDWTSCAACGQPTPVPMSHMLRPRAPHETDPPRRFVMHARCAERPIISQEEETP